MNLSNSVYKPNPRTKNTKLSKEKDKYVWFPYDGTVVPDGGLIKPYFGEFKKNEFLVQYQSKISHAPMPRLYL